MALRFPDKSILIVLNDEPIMQMLTGICALLRFKHIKDTNSSDEAFKECGRHTYDIIITDLQSGRGLIEKTRKADDTVKNPLIPVVLTCGQEDAKKVEEFRSLGVTDLLLSPFMVDDIRARFSYIFEHSPQHTTSPKPEEPIPSAPPVEGASSEEEEGDLLKSLLGHYIQHQEAVLKKLHFAQDATLKSIQEIRNVEDDLKTHDNTNLHQFSRFEEMWKEIIGLFLCGGLSEDDIFKIEDLITNIPGDIKQHYNRLTQQDKSFLTLLEAMNHDAYRKARDITVKVQEAPNPMTGMTRDDYTARIFEEPTVDEASFVFKPSQAS